MALDVLERLGTGDFHQAGGQINVEYLLRDDGAGWHQFRVPNEQRNPDARFVHGSFVGHSMFTEKHAVVAGKDNDRVVKLPGVDQGLVELSDTVVDRWYGRGIGPHEVGELYNAGG